MGAQVAITQDGTTIFFDLLDEDSDKIVAKIRKVMEGFIVSRTEVG